MLNKIISPTHPYFKSLNVSWKEGIAAAFMTSMTDYFTIPLALLLHATPQEIGFLVAIPQLLASFSQLFAVKLVELLGSRLNFLVRAVMSQAAILILVALLPLLPIDRKILILIIFACGFKILAQLIATIWGSLTSDYLAPEERGTYFGWRSQIIGIAGLLAIILGGILLTFFKSISPFFAFSFLFTLTAAARFLSGSLMTQMDDVHIQHKEGSNFTFFRFLIRVRQSNFVKFTLYTAAIMFSTQIAAPYFSVHMLKNLHFSYLFYVCVQISSAIAGLIAFPLWGKHADLVGNAKVLKTTSFLIPLIPILWMFTRHLGLLVCIEFFSGFVWCGFNLCCTNFIYDAVSQEKRVRCLSYFNLINGIAIFSGASLGGYLAEHLPAFLGYRLITLFLISGIFRFFSHFLLSKQFEEVRKTKQNVSSTKLFFSVVGIRPLAIKNKD